MEIRVDNFSPSIYSFIGREFVNKYRRPMPYTQQEAADLLIKNIALCLDKNKVLTGELEGLDIFISLNEDNYQEDVHTLGSVNLILLSERLNIALSAHLVKDILFAGIGGEKSNLEQIEATVAHELVHLIDSNALMNRYENIHRFGASIQSLAVIFSNYRDEGIAKLYEYLLGYDVFIGSEDGFSDMYNAMNIFGSFNFLDEAGKIFISERFDIKNLLDIVKCFSYVFGPLMVMEGLYHLTDGEAIKDILLNVIDDTKERKMEKLDEETAASIIKEAIKYSPYEYFAWTFLYDPEKTLFNYEDKGGRDSFSQLIYYLRETLDSLWDERQGGAAVFEELRKKKAARDMLAILKAIEASVLMKEEDVIKEAITDEIQRLKLPADKKSNHKFTKEEKAGLQEKIDRGIPDNWKTVLENYPELKKDYDAAIQDVKNKIRFADKFFLPLFFLGSIGGFIGIIVGMIMKSLLIGSVSSVLFSICLGIICHSISNAILITIGVWFIYFFIILKIKTIFFL